MNAVIKSNKVLSVDLLYTGDMLDGSRQYTA
jgi:pyruvate carboxylase